MTALLGHSPSPDLPDFYNGLLHPLLTLPSFLLLLGLALCGTISVTSAARRARWLLLALIPGVALGLASGAAIPAARLPQTLSLVELILIGFIIICGLLTAAAWLLPEIALGTLGLAGGAIVSLGQTLEIRMQPQVSLLWLYLLGMALGLLILQLLLLAALTVLRQKFEGKERFEWLPIVHRVAGSWLAAIGTLIFAFALSPGPTPL